MLTLSNENLLGLASGEPSAEAEVTYADLAKRLKKHGFKETEASVTNNLSVERSRQRGFWLCLPHSNWMVWL
jgi:hypothetical protein